jgi:serine/threonine protein kinase
LAERRGFGERYGLGRAARVIAGASSSCRRVLAHWTATFSAWLEDTLDSNGHLRQLEWVGTSSAERAAAPPSVWDSRLPSGPPTAAITVCPQCRSPVRPEVLLGLCPFCLARGLRATIEPRGERIGDYVLGEWIGGGGMGEIFLATHVETRVAVAIKFARPELLATPDGIAIFRNEINTISRLNHPNIARVYPSTCDGGRQYFVMELLEGGTLEDETNRRRYASPRAAAKLISTLASAVQCAHSHGILHCDIKPTNVLFDLDRNPKVTDFGLGRHLDESGLLDASQLPLGTTGWRSPEQADRKNGSARSDVFQLGLMLDWLLTGDESQAVVATTPPPARWAPTLECSLELISRKARRFDANQRYETAAEFADDLNRALRNLPIREELSYASRRLLRWAHRHRLFAALLVTAVCLLAGLPFMLDTLLADVRRWISEQNQFVAKAQAVAVRNQLQVDAASMEKMASDEEIPPLMTWRDLSRSPPALVRHQGRFDNVFLFSIDGSFQARSPLPERYLGTDNFLFRDYHRCARELGTRLLAANAPITSVPVCVSRVFRSSTDARLKFSLAAPLIEGGKLVGVATGSIQARDRFASIEMRCGPGQCMTALIGPRDRDDQKSPVPNTLVVFAHPSLKKPWVNPQDAKDERRLDPATVERICRALRCTPDLEAPFAEPEHGPIVLDALEEPVTRQHSVVALAPVGRTGLIVMVATPDTALEEIKSALRWRAWMYLWIPFLAGMALVAGMLMYPQIVRARERRRARTRSGHG